MQTPNPSPSRFAERSSSFHGIESAIAAAPGQLRRPKTLSDLPSASMNSVGQAEVRPKLTKVLLNVTIQGSVGALHVLIKPESTVVDLIAAAVAQYVKEGRRPVLPTSDPSSFDLHYSQFSLESLDRKEKVVELGSRNLWKWRNEVVFCGDKFGGCRTSVVISHVKDYTTAWLRRSSKFSRSKTELFVCWQAPPINWVRLNTDGSLRSGHATAGGVLRDNFGSWIKGFVHNIGRCSVPMAELWGIASGLHLAWESGYRRVCIDTDSQVAVLLLSKPVESYHPLASLLTLVSSFLRRDWVIQFRHTFREANRVADALATLAFDFPLGVTVLDDPPGCTLSFLCDDARGVFLSRLAFV